jgi:electron transport complex protein RnfC
VLLALPKSYDELLPLVENRMVTLICEGCREVYFPENEVIAMCDRLLVNRPALAVITSDYVCSSSISEPRFALHLGDIEAADALLVFSCGVGAQSIAGLFSNKPVYAACDTYPLPGRQGVTPLEFDCVGCAKCHLNDTGGICPVTTCSKSLVNGQCGGAKNGKCETDKDRECGWELIYKRLKEREVL